MEGISTREREKEREREKDDDDDDDDDDDEITFTTVSLHRGCRGDPFASVRKKKRVISLSLRICFFFQLRSSLASLIALCAPGFQRA